MLDGAAGKNCLLVVTRIMVLLMGPGLGASTMMLGILTGVDGVVLHLISMSIIFINWVIL